MKNQLILSFILMLSVACSGGSGDSSEVTAKNNRPVDAPVILSPENTYSAIELSRKRDVMRGVCQLELLYYMKIDQARCTILYYPTSLEQAKTVDQYIIYLSKYLENQRDDLNPVFIEDEVEEKKFFENVSKNIRQQNNDVQRALQENAQSLQASQKKALDFYAKAFQGLDCKSASKESQSKTECTNFPKPVDSDVSASLNKQKDFVAAVQAQNNLLKMYAEYPMNRLQSEVRKIQKVRENIVAQAKKNSVIWGTHLLGRLTTLEESIEQQYNEKIVGEISLSLYPENYHEIRFELDTYYGLSEASQLKIQEAYTQGQKLQEFFAENLKILQAKLFLTFRIEADADYKRYDDGDYDIHPDYKSFAIQMPLNSDKNSWQSFLENLDNLTNNPKLAEQDQKVEEWEAKSKRLQSLENRAFMPVYFNSSIFSPEQYNGHLSSMLEEANTFLEFVDYLDQKTEERKKSFGDAFTGQEKVFVLRETPGYPFQETDENNLFVYYFFSLNKVEAQSKVLRWFSTYKIPDEIKELLNAN